MQLSLKAGQMRVWAYVRWVSEIQLGIFRFFEHGVQTRSRAQLCFQWTTTSEAECNSHRRTAEFLRDIGREGVLRRVLELDPFNGLASSHRSRQPQGTKYHPRQKTQASIHRPSQDSDRDDNTTPE